MNSFLPASNLNRSPISEFAAKAAGFVASGRNGISALGTNAKFSTTTEGRVEARAERYRLQSHAQRLLWNEGVKLGLPYPANFHKTIKCLRVRVRENVDILKSREHGTAFYGGGLVVCGKPGCPVCSAKVQERRRLEIAQAFDWAYGSQGKKVVMVTLTFSHHYGQSLNDLLSLQAKALATLRKDNRWKKFKDRVGFDGMIRSLEVTHGKNGWHPHTHEAWIVDAEADADHIKEFVTTRWHQICDRLGMVTPGKEDAFKRHSVDVIDQCRASDYLAKQDQTVHWGADRELAKSSTKKGRKAGRSVFQLLADGADGCKSSDQLYTEFVEAMKGKQILRWSQGLKARVGIDDLSDDEIADKNDDKADLLALLKPEDWRIVVAHDARAYILTLAEKGGLDAVNRWLAAPEIPPVRPDQVAEKGSTVRRSGEGETGDKPNRHKSFSESCDCSFALMRSANCGSSDIDFSMTPDKSRALRASSFVIRSRRRAILSSCAAAFCSAASSCSCSDLFIRQSSSEDFSGDG